MQGHNWHQFLKQFFMLFPMVPSVLLSMVALITTYLKESDWLLKNLHKSESGWKSYHQEGKTEGTMWKSIQNCVRDSCQKWPCILFWANYPENKQCMVISRFWSVLFCTGSSKSNKTGNNSLNRTSRDCRDDVGAEDCVKKDSTNSFNSSGSSGFASSCSGGGGATQDMEALAGVCSLLLAKQ